MKQHSSKLLIVLAFFAIYVIWGSTYLFNKIAVTALPPFFLASIRFYTAGFLIMIIAKILKFKIGITRKQFLNTLIAGFLFLVYGNGVFVWLGGICSSFLLNNVKVILWLSDNNYETSY